MQQKDDRNNLVDYVEHDNGPDYSNNIHSPCNNSAIKGCFWKFYNLTNQLNLIYIGIVAALSAVTVALILTIFFGSPQVKYLALAYARSRLMRSYTLILGTAQMPESNLCCKNEAMQLML